MPEDQQRLIEELRAMLMSSRFLRKSPEWVRCRRADKDKSGPLERRA